MDMIEFLLARITDDEAAARRELDELQAEGLGAGGLISHLVSVEVNDVPSISVDHTRVLAECRAKRVAAGFYLDDDPNVMAATIMAMVAVYADHPDFDPAWVES